MLYDRYEPIERLIPGTAEELDRSCGFGPVSMFWGELDPVSVVKMADAWKDMQPKIELHKWPDVAHWPSIDVPDRVAKVILDRYWH